MKKLLALVLALMLVVSVAASAETVRVMTFWGEATKHAGVDAINKAVMELYPEYTFEASHLVYDDYWAKIKTEMAASDPPSIVAGRVREMVEMIDAGKILDLTDTDFIKHYTDEQLLEAVYKDRIWQVPLDLQFGGAFYRKEMFREVLGTDEPPKTKSEFIEILQKFRDAGYIPFAFGGSQADPCNYTIANWIDPYLYFVNPHENYELIRGEKTFATSQLYHDAYVDIYNIFIPNIDPSDMGIPRERSYDMFLNQERPMAIHGTFNIGTFRSGDPDGDFGLFPIPWSEDPEQNIPEVNTDNDIMILADGNVDAAMKWFEFFTSVDGLNIWAEYSGCLPASDLTKDVKTDPMADYCFSLYNAGKYYRLGTVDQWPGALGNERNNMHMKFVQDAVLAYQDGVDAETFVAGFLQEMDDRMSQYYDQYIDVASQNVEA